LKLYATFGLPVLLLAAVFTLASCGGVGGGDVQGMNQDEKGKPGGGEMQDTDHGKKDGSGGTSGMGDMEGMDHGSGGTASGMVMENGKYSDELFIDAMVPHHEGAVDMAEVALKNADHNEIKQLAEDIVSAQEAEIRKLKSIKQEEFGTSRVPMGMNAEQMEGMGMKMDPQSLAAEDPFDKAFIDNMIPHHQSAIEMAEVAAKETANPKIKDLANDIVEAQKREISQMEQWSQEWYPNA
jgi:uncharacterized protein (DUF305 family)